MKIAMIELTGKCPRACPTCLPKHLKTGREMMWAEITNIGIQMEAAGFAGVTFAGFGEPATHPAIEKAIMYFQEHLGMNVQVVCRPDNINEVAEANILRISVQGWGDAVCVMKNAFDCWISEDIRIHVVLDRGTAQDRSWRNMLIPQLGIGIQRISVSLPLVLCDDPVHVQAVVDSNKEVFPSAWEELRAFRASLPPEKVERFRLLGPGDFGDKCAFFNGMIYIDSNLKIRPCCHQPLGLELGDLNRQSVCQVLDSDVWKNWQSTGKKSAACQRCPDLGVSRDG